MITNLAGSTLPPFALHVSHHPVSAQEPIVPALGEPIQPKRLDTDRETGETALNARPRKPHGGFRAATRSAADDADRIARGFWPGALTWHEASPSTPNPEINRDPGGVHTTICDEHTALLARIQRPLPGEHCGKPLAEVLDSADNVVLLQNTEDGGIGVVPVHIDRETS